MSHHITRNHFVAVLLTAAISVLAGCASNKPEPKAATPPPAPPATLTQIKNEITAAKAQLDVTTASMNMLVKSTPADVQSNFDKFMTEQAKLKSLADACRARSEDLKSRTQTYFDQWNKQAEVQNAELRRSATMQRVEAERTFSTIKSEVELARLSFEPYMSRLSDITNYLKSNMSPAALATVGDIAGKATADSAEVNKHLDAVLGGINKIMTASGESPAAPAGSAVPAASGQPGQQK